MFDKVVKKGKANPRPGEKPGPGRGSKKNRFAKLPMAFKF